MMSGHASSRSPDKGRRAKAKSKSSKRMKDTSSMQQSKSIDYLDERPLDTLVHSKSRERHDKKKHRNEKQRNRDPLTNCIQCLLCGVCEHVRKTFASYVITVPLFAEFGLFRNWKLTIIVTGLVSAFINEIMPDHPRYNTSIMLAIMASETLPVLPIKTVRPQIFMTLLVLLSFGMDIVFMTYASPETIALMMFVMIGKFFALMEFLAKAPGTARSRKYLARRFRLFGIPCYVPRRIMRDIRARILALGWVHFVGVWVYLVLFILSVTVFEYLGLFTTSNQKITISLAYLCKTVSTALVAYGVAADSDITLCVGYFGCLGCMMKYLKTYLHKRKEELGGFPYPFRFNELRFICLFAVKLTDICVGVMVWISLVKIGYRNKPTELQAYMGVGYLTVTVTDIWCTFLFFAVFWLIGKYKVAKDNHELGDSDDSELDEQGMRNPPPPDDDDAALRTEKAMKRRAKYLKRLAKLSKYDTENPARGAHDYYNHDAETGLGEDADVADVPLSIMDSDRGFYESKMADIGGYGKHFDGNGTEKERSRGHQNRKNNLGTSHTVRTDTYAIREMQPSDHFGSGYAYGDDYSFTLGGGQSNYEDILAEAEANPLLQAIRADQFASPATNTGRRKSYMCE